MGKNLENKTGFLTRIKKVVSYTYRLLSLEIPAYIVAGTSIPKKAEINNISTKNRVVYSSPFGVSPSR